MCRIRAAVMNRRQIKVVQKIDCNGITLKVEGARQSSLSKHMERVLRVCG